MPIDYTARLRSRLTQQQIPSFRALARQADVSEWSVRQLRVGKAEQLRGRVLVQLAQTLGYSLPELLQQFSAIPVELPSSTAHPDETGFQKTALDALESWLRQWPTVVAAIAQNPELPASRVVPLLHPVENLLAQWEVDAIATVGEVLPYDPQWHQLLTGVAQPGEPVRVRYVGYRHQGNLLFRAQVSPV